MDRAVESHGQSRRKSWAEPQGAMGRAARGHGQSRRGQQAEPLLLLPLPPPLLLLLLLSLFLLSLSLLLIHEWVQAWWPPLSGPYRCHYCHCCHHCLPETPALFQPHPVVGLVAFSMFVSLQPVASAMGFNCARFLVSLSLRSRNKARSWRMAKKSCDCAWNFNCGFETAFVNVKAQHSPTPAEILVKTAYLAP